MDTVGSDAVGDGLLTSNVALAAPVANLNPAAKLPLSGLWRCVCRQWLGPLMNHAATACNVEVCSSHE